MGAQKPNLFVLRIGGIKWKSWSVPHLPGKLKLIQFASFSGWCWCGCPNCWKSCCTLERLFVLLPQEAFAFSFFKRRLAFPSHVFTCSSFNPDSMPSASLCLFDGWGLCKLALSHLSTWTVCSRVALFRRDPALLDCVGGACAAYCCNRGDLSGK